MPVKGGGGGLPLRKCNFFVGDKTKYKSKISVLKKDM